MDFFRQVDLFTKEKLPANAKLDDVSITSSVGSNAATWVGDNCGFVYRIDDTTNQFRAFDIDVIELLYSPDLDTLLCIGRDQDHQGGIHCKLYNCALFDQSHCPTFTKQSKVQKSSKMIEPISITAITALKDFSLIAIGTTSYGVILIHNIMHEKGKIEYIRDVGSSITGVQFTSVYNTDVLFVTTNNSVASVLCPPKKPPFILYNELSLDTIRSRCVCALPTLRYVVSPDDILTACERKKNIKHNEAISQEPHSPNNDSISVSSSIFYSCSEIDSGIEDSDGDMDADNASDASFGGRLYRPPGEKKKNILEDKNDSSKWRRVFEKAYIPIFEELYGPRENKVEKNEFSDNLTSYGTYGGILTVQGKDNLFVIYDPIFGVITRYTFHTFKNSSIYSINNCERYVCVLSREPSPQKSLIYGEEISSNASPYVSRNDMINIVTIVQLSLPQSIIVAREADDNVITILSSQGAINYICNRYELASQKIVTKMVRLKSVSLSLQLQILMKKKLFDAASYVGVTEKLSTHVLKSIYIKKGFYHLYHHQHIEAVICFIQSFPYMNHILIIYQLLLDYKLYELCIYLHAMISYYERSHTQVSTEYNNLLLTFYFKVLLQINDERIINNILENTYMSKENIRTLLEQSRQHQLYHIAILICQVYSLYDNYIDILIHDLSKYRKAVKIISMLFQNQKTEPLTLPSLNSGSRPAPSIPAPLISRPELLKILQHHGDMLLQKCTAEMTVMAVTYLSFDEVDDLVAVHRTFMQYPLLHFLVIVELYLKSNAAQQSKNPNLPQEYQNAIRQILVTTQLLLSQVEKSAALNEENGKDSGGASGKRSSKYKEKEERTRKGSVRIIDDLSQAISIKREHKYYNELSEIVKAWKSTKISEKELQMLVSVKDAENEKNNNNQKIHSHRTTNITSQLFPQFLKLNREVEDKSKGNMSLNGIPLRQLIQCIISAFDEQRNPFSLSSLLERKLLYRVVNDIEVNIGTIIAIQNRFSALQASDSHFLLEDAMHLPYYHFSTMKPRAVSSTMRYYHACAENYISLIEKYELMRYIFPQSLLTKVLRRDMEGFSGHYFDVVRSIIATYSNSSICRFFINECQVIVEGYERAAKGNSSKITAGILMTYNKEENRDGAAHNVFERSVLHLADFENYSLTVEELRILLDESLLSGAGNQFKKNIDSVIGTWSDTIDTRREIRKIDSESIQLSPSSCIACGGRLIDTEYTIFYCSHAVHKICMGSKHSCTVCVGLHDSKAALMEQKKAHLHNTENAVQFISAQRTFKGAISFLSAGLISPTEKDEEPMKTIPTTPKSNRKKK